MTGCALGGRTTRGEVTISAVEVEEKGPGGSWRRSSREESLSVLLFRAVVAWVVEWASVTYHRLGGLNQEEGSKPGGAAERASWSCVLFLALAKCWPGVQAWWWRLSS